jgi:hypothetical protein
MISIYFTFHRLVDQDGGDASVVEGEVEGELYFTI